MEIAIINNALLTGVSLFYYSLQLLQSKEA